MNEQRRLQRFDIRLKTTVTFPDLQSTGMDPHCYTKDISSKGVFLLTDHAPEVGVVLDLAFSVPLISSDGTEKRVTLLKASGQIIRAEKNGMAVLFDTPFQITAS